MPVICPKPGHWGKFLIVDSYESRDLTLQTLSSVMVICSCNIAFQFLTLYPTRSNRKLTPMSLLNYGDGEDSPNLS
jgi:hypothetical protein